MSAKRAFDLVLAIAGVIALSPLLLVIACWIRLDSRGSAFFRQVRVGRRGHPFRIIKFRTMVTNAASLGGSITPTDDPRITRAGRVLRKLKLDELPQLFNVAFGDMSLVGPRPEVPRYVEMYSDELRKVLELRPGITDPASIVFRDEGNMLARAADPEETYVTVLMPEKIRLNLDYARTASVWTDAAVIIQTLVCLFGRRKGRTATGSGPGIEH